MTSPSSAAAFEALSVVVRDRGIDIADDPARLRGMLNDVLATDARVNRSAVDALVLAAEIGVPHDLSTTPVADVPRLTAQLASRGVAPDLADQTVRAWIAAAQGGRTAPAPEEQVAPLAPAAATVLPATVLPGALPPPPPAPAPIGATVVPAAPPAAPREGTVPTTSPSADEAGTPTGAMPAPVLVPPPPPGPPAGTGDGSGSGLPRRAIVALVAAIVAVLAIVGGVLAFGGGDDGDAAGPTTTAPPTSAPVTTAAPEDVLLEVLTPAGGTEATTRDVEMTGRTAPGATVTVNGTAATVDAAGSWKLTVSLPDPETKFAVVATTSKGATKSVDWVVKRDSVAPALDIIDPIDGAVLNTRTVALRGTTEHNTTVLVDGVGAGGDATTSTDTVLGWFADVTINGDQQTFTVTSTDPAGNVTTKTVTLRFQASAPPTLPRPPIVPKPPTGGPGPTAPPTTQPPAPSIVAVNDDAGTWNFAAGDSISFNVVGNDSGDWTDIEYGGLSGGYGTLSRLSGGFFQYTMRDPGNWTETFQYRLRNSSTGAVSNWATVTFHIVCSC